MTSLLIVPSVLSITSRRGVDVTGPVAAARYFSSDRSSVELELKDVLDHVADLVAWTTKIRTVFPDKSVRASKLPSRYF